jgi:preprotein translocase subunit SecG
MAIFETVLLILHILVAVAICGFVLLQHGKGADMGAAFGSGSSGSVFGSAGSANFLSRSTAALATVFFLSSLALTWYGASKSAPRDVMQEGVMGKIPVQPGLRCSGVALGARSGASAVDPLKSLPAAPVPSAPAGSKSGEVPK